MTVSKTPPGRGSALIWASGALVPAGPQKCVRCSGSIRQRNTSSRGASKVRVKLSSPSSWSVMVISRWVRLLDVAQVLVELVEPLVPDPPALLDPAERLIERLGPQMAGPELGVAGAGDGPAALQHLQVLGDARQRHAERRRQFGHGRVAGRQPGHDGPPGWVGQRGERGVQRVR